MANVGKSWIISHNEMFAPGGAATAIKAAIDDYIATPVTIVSTSIFHACQLNDGRLVMVLVYANS